MRSGSGSVFVAMLVLSSFLGGCGLGGAPELEGAELAVVAADQEGALGERALVGEERARSGFTAQQAVVHVESAAPLGWAMTELRLGVDLRTLELGRTYRTSALVERAEGDVVPGEMLAAAGASALERELDRRTDDVELLLEARSARSVRVHWSAWFPVGRDVEHASGWYDLAVTTL